MPSVNLLMTGAGAPGAPGIIQCLKKAEWINLLVGDADENAVGRYLHPNFVLLPKASDPAFLPRVFEICLDKKIDLILPLVTRELFPFAAAKKEFAARGIQVLVSDEEPLGLANNKAACYQFLKSKNIAVPAFEVVHSVGAFESAAKALGFPKQSFCFKPAVSNGSRGFRIVQDHLDEADLLFHQKPYQTFISYENALRVLSQKAFPDLLVTAYLPGDEYSVDCIAENGKAAIVVPRLRKKMVNGISIQGEFIEDQAIIQYCRDIIQAIGLHGNIGIQLKKNQNDEPLLLEINPRVQGTIVAGLGANINLPLLAVQQEIGIPIEPSRIDIRWGTKFWRYWSEVYTNV